MNVLTSPGTVPAREKCHRPALRVTLQSIHPVARDSMSQLIHALLFDRAEHQPDAQALGAHGVAMSYRELAARTRAFAGAAVAAGVGRLDRVAVWLDKRVETVVSIMGAAAAGAVFVPINPVLRAAQAAHILGDAQARLLVTSADRWASLSPWLATLPGLRCVVLAPTSRSQPASADPSSTAAAVAADAGPAGGDAAGAPTVLDVETFMRGQGVAPHRVIDADMAAILYTSGSTGQPKGVVLSHRNLVAGARSVAAYLGNTPDDRILAVLPLSFDYGLSQLTTAFASGACVVLHNHLLAADVVRAVARERITGLAAVPPLWIQLAGLAWPAAAGQSLRYFTNSGGAMPTATLAALRARLPRARPFLMYGLTEAFRSTYLPPEEIDRRPDSIGRAIPNAEVLVVRADGSECAVDEPGELVHRGALVALGYWNDPQRTAERFRPLPGQRPELVLPELAVWSGDTVRRDAEGFLYFIGRRDEMIKTSGYRVSPTEVEEVLYRSGRVAEAAACGVAHPVLGQAIVVVAQPAPGATADSAALLALCRETLPGYMLPTRIDWCDAPLPRNANGKIDRRLLAEQRAHLFAQAA
jgi:acyl-CoA ligase (AMP-forming) (exosortase A-associated)